MVGVRFRVRIKARIRALGWEACRALGAALSVPVRDRPADRAQERTSTAYIEGPVSEGCVELEGVNGLWKSPPRNMGL